MTIAVLLLTFRLRQGYYESFSPTHQVLVICSPNCPDLESSTPRVSFAAPHFCFSRMLVKARPRYADIFSLLLHFITATGKNETLTPLQLIPVQIKACTHGVLGPNDHTTFPNLKSVCVDEGQMHLAVRIER